MNVSCSWNFIVEHIPTGNIYKELDIITITTHAVRVSYDLWFPLEECCITINEKHFHN